MKSKEEIEQLAFLKYPRLINDNPLCRNPNNPMEDDNTYERKIWIGAYTQCQEDMAEKKLDEDDIKEMALDFIINIGDLPKTIEEWHKDLWKFYQSLNKQD